MRIKALSVALGLSVACTTVRISSAFGTNHIESIAEVMSSQSQPVEQTFTGKIMSQNGVRFILRDEQTDNWYNLDDQAKASKFLGKRVLIKGTLDGASGTIHIIAIFS
jgi:hypothetical protein